jgi:hypothetical protein
MGDEFCVRLLARQAADPGRGWLPIQTGGVTASPGLYFVGLPWLPTAKSGLLYGVGDNASFIAGAIMERNHEFRPVDRAA